MANPYSDDLRRRILEAYAQGEGTQQQLAGRFRVSVGYVAKIRSQQLRTGREQCRPRFEIHRAIGIVQRSKSSTRRADTEITFT